jgi:hypothetical protein
VKNFGGILINCIIFRRQLAIIEVKRQSIKRLNLWIFSGLNKRESQRLKALAGILSSLRGMQ